MELCAGALVEIEVLIAGRRTTHDGIVVDRFRGETDVQLIGIRFVSEEEETTGDRRAGTRWLCNETYFPTCMAATPGRFDDFMYFQVRDVSESGLQLTTSLRNKFLVPGMRFELTAVFPMGSVAPISVVVARVGVVSIAGHDRLVVGAEFQDLSTPSRQAIGQYLLQFSLSRVSSRELKAAGFFPTSIASGIDFFSVKTASDYQAVLQLRFRAHAESGNTKDDVTPEMMGDRTDAASRVLAGSYKGRVVATARLQFSDFNDLLLESGESCWPEALPKKYEMIEVSRLATDPEFRSGDLLLALVKVCTSNVVQRDRPWVVISCLDEMVPFYEKLGFKRSGVRHKESLWKDGKILNVLVANSFDAVQGKGVDAVYWVMVYKPIAEQLMSAGVIVPKGLDRLRIALFRLVSLLPLPVLRRRRPRKH
ncbi:MAG: hypothetical protein AAF662_03345 [Pseudomonadota bacterium]